MTGGAIARELGGRRTGRGWMARCPAHEDRTPSLSITERDGRVLVHCQAGCPQADVIDALRSRGLWPEPVQQEWTPAQRREWAAARRELERDLPDARYWRRAAVSLAEEVLDREKSRLFDAGEGPADLSAIRHVSGMLARLRAGGDVALVHQYRDWRGDAPHTTARMIQWARQREETEARALCRYLGFPRRAAAAYLAGMR